MELQLQFSFFCEAINFLNLQIFFILIKKKGKVKIFISKRK